MNPNSVFNIDDVISALDEIILTSQQNNDPADYFAALYRKVTVKVKEGIASGFFDDGPRMEQLDVLFAKRYLDAYSGFSNQQPVMQSWQKVFKLLTRYRPTVLQHLLMGMNAHINLDLGIAAAEVSKGKNIDLLEQDFNRINKILSSLIHEVEADLSEVWPTLKHLLKLAGKVDDFLVNFSMQLARDGAWKFARELATAPEEQWQQLNIERDSKVAAKSAIITRPGLAVSAILFIIRLMERGSVTDKISKLA
jgi:hypothetical protein